MNKNLTENEIYELIRDASECDGEPELPDIAATLAPKKRMSVRAMLPLAACFLAFSVGCGLILSALRGAGAPLVPDGAAVTEEYLEEEFPGLLLPSAEGYETSSVFLYSDGDTPRYAALIYTAESAQLDYKVVSTPTSNTILPGIIRTMRRSAAWTCRTRRATEYRTRRFRPAATNIISLCRRIRPRTFWT